MSKEKERVLVWEKFVHAYSNGTELDFPGVGGYKPPEEDKLPYDDSDIRMLDMDDMMDEISIRKPIPKRVLFTPYGMLPLSDYNDISRLFNFWIAHTNFYLSDKVLTLVEKTEGVEALTPISPYRFRIAIGRAFDSAEVKTAIQNRLQCKVKDVSGIKPARY